ncbi:hypothetical protein IBX65_02435 [Candidatus Aerophobetes bacterium]|nr:hypothetical protein [Candidatus Aerophobetes bacterium]
MKKVRKVVGLLVVLAVVIGIGSLAYSKDLSGRFSIGYEREMVPRDPMHSWSPWWGYGDGILLRGWFTPSLGVEGAFGMNSWQETQYYYSEPNWRYHYNVTSFVARVLFKVLDTPNSHLYVGAGPRFHNFRETNYDYCDGWYLYWEREYRGTGFDAFLGFEWFPAWPENVAISAQWGYSQISYERDHSDIYYDYDYALSATPLRLSIAYYLGENK